MNKLLSLILIGIFTSALSMGVFAMEDASVTSDAKAVSEGKPVKMVKKTKSKANKKTSLKETATKLLKK